MATMTTISRLAEEMEMSPNTLYALARRDDDPLPLRTLKGMKRSSALVVDDWLAWYERNTDLFKEVQHG